MWKLRFTFVQGHLRPHHIRSFGSWATAEKVYLGTYGSKEGGRNWFFGAMFTNQHIMEVEILFSHVHLRPQSEIPAGTGSCVWAWEHWPFNSIYIISIKSAVVVSLKTWLEHFSIWAFLSHNSNFARDCHSQAFLSWGKRQTDHFPSFTWIRIKGMYWDRHMWDSTMCCI